MLSGFTFSASSPSYASVKGFQGQRRDSRSLPRMRRAARRKSIRSPIRGARRSTCTIRSAACRRPGISRGWPTTAVGYFLTALKDYSKQTDRDQFVRYINRWDLQKAEPTAKVSPPKTPIIFWIENTVPFQYRKPIREGILEWNQAFEKAGFVNAIEVRQQPGRFRLGSGRHQLQHVSLDHVQRGVRHGAVAGQSRTPARSSTPTSFSTPTSCSIGRTNSTRPNRC